VGTTSELFPEDGNAVRGANHGAGLGNQYVLGLNAENCNTGETFGTEQVIAEGRERVLKALEKAAARKLLGGHVSRRAGDFSRLAFVFLCYGKPEIRDAYSAEPVEHNICMFEVAM
jgi:hypothetical protein